MRSEKAIVSISDNNVSRPDNQLKERGKVNATIVNINSTHSSYLHLKIKACDVNSTIDQETYYCHLVAHRKNSPTIDKTSDKVHLNITGDQEHCVVSSHAVLAGKNSFLIIIVTILPMTINILLNFIEHPMQN